MKPGVQSKSATLKPFAAWSQSSSFASTDANVDKTLVLIRTHYIDDLVTGLIDKIQKETGFTVYLVLDETKGPLEKPANLKQVSLTQDLFASMRLYSTPDVGWRCGDYALYAARLAVPDAGYFWMIEPDVRISQEDLGRFFQHFGEHRSYDMLAPYYGDAGPEYKWTAMIAPFSAHPKKCMFPIVRFSARALDYLLLRRRILSQVFWNERYRDGRLRSLEIWPNDEVFTATMIQEGGFQAADLNSTGTQFYDEQTFSYAFPISLQRFASRPMDGRVYHPVLASDAFLRKTRSMLEHLRRNAGPASLIRGLFDRQELYDDITAECGAAEAQAFAADVRASLETLGA